MTRSGTRLRLRVAALVAAASVPLLAGCFSYRPLASTTVPPKTQIRFVFTADGARALRDAAGFELRQLDGVVVRTVGDSAVVVRPDAIVTMDGDALPWRRGELLVPWRTVDRPQQRVVDKRRTRGFVAAMTAAFTGVVYFALKSVWSGSGTTLQAGPGVPE